MPRVLGFGSSLYFGHPLLDAWFAWFPLNQIQYDGTAVGEIYNLASRIGERKSESWIIEWTKEDERVPTYADTLKNAGHAYSAALVDGVWGRFFVNPSSLQRFDPKAWFKQWNMLARRAEAEDRLMHVVDDHRLSELFLPESAPEKTNRLRRLAIRTRDVVGQGRRTSVVAPGFVKRAFFKFDVAPIKLGWMDSVTSPLQTEANGS